MFPISSSLWHPSGRDRAKSVDRDSLPRASKHALKRNATTEDFFSLLSDYHSYPILKSYPQIASTSQKSPDVFSI